MKKSLIVAALALGLSACAAAPTQHPSIVIGAQVGVEEGIALNPYETDGTWKIPDEIKPGEYRVESTAPIAWYQFCTDVFCTPKSIIPGSNMMVPAGGGYVVVPADAAAINMRGIRLHP